jgi:hypothetical protein
VPNLKVLLQYSCGGTEEIHDKPVRISDTHRCDNIQSDYKRCELLHTFVGKNRSHHL